MDDLDDIRAAAAHGSVLPKVGSIQLQTVRGLDPIVHSIAGGLDGVDMASGPT